MDFVTLDFETASAAGDSVCEIGLAFVSGGKVIGTYGRLVRPPGNRFDYWNTKVHGIRPEDVENEPSFAELWPEIFPLLNNKFVIAHNASFDFGVLQKSIAANRLSFPSLYYACSVQISRRVWTGLEKYNLGALCAYHGIPLNHHRAEHDSKATAQLCIKAFDEAGVESPQDVLTKIQTKIWKLEAGSRTPISNKPVSERRQRARKPIQAPPQRENLNPLSIFYKKRVVFTGTLSSLKRLEALQAIMDIGGIPEERVSPQTDFVVIGRNDFAPAGLKSISSKQREALRLITAGVPIRFITEEEFISHLGR